MSGIAMYFGELNDEKEGNPELHVHKHQPQIHN